MHASYGHLRLLFLPPSTSNIRVVIIMTPWRRLQLFLLRFATRLVSLCQSSSVSSFLCDGRAFLVPLRNFRLRLSSSLGFVTSADRQVSTDRQSDRHTLVCMLHPSSFSSADSKLIVHQNRILCCFYINNIVTLVELRWRRTSEENEVRYFCYAENNDEAEEERELLL